MGRGLNTLLSGATGRPVCTMNNRQYGACGRDEAAKPNQMPVKALLRSSTESAVAAAGARNAEY
jgi:hypothetical protein